MTSPPAARTLAMVSLAQLCCGVAGLLVAIRKGHAYDLLWWHGPPDKVLRDALGPGTALSAPAPMLVAQAASIAALRRGPDVVAQRWLTALGAAMVPGYLVERHVRARLQRAGWHPVETPLTAAGLGLAAAMAAVGARSIRGR